MKLFKKTKLNSKGFGHVELVMGVAVVAVIAVIGTRILTASHAATIPAPPAATSSTPGFVTVNGPSGSVMEIYTSDISNQISATGEFIPGSSGLKLKIDKVFLYACDDTTYKTCEKVGSGATIVNYTGNGENVYYAATSAAPVNGSDVYEGCAEFVAGTTLDSTECSGYVMYPGTTTKWTPIKSSYQTSAGEPTFNGCVVKQNSITEEIKIEAIRSTSSVLSQALLWAPNLVTGSPVGDIQNTNWVNNVSISQATLPKADQTGISYQIANSGYGFTAPAPLPTNFGVCD